MKKVWISALSRDHKAVQKLMGTIKSYGMDADGHFWVDDLKRMAWNAPLEELQVKETAMWIIVGSADNFGKESIRFGLSMLALSVQFKRGMGFPILLVLHDGELSTDSLPTPLKGAEILPSSLPTLGTKIVARANMPVKSIETGYHLYAHALQNIGLWFEVGPGENAEWHGSLFGVHGAEIDFHGVGPAGGIPERTVLEYPMKGMKIQFGEKEFIAWAVQNRLDRASSYYVRVQGEPDTIIFGPYADNDEAEVHLISLR